MKKIFNKLILIILIVFSMYSTIIYASNIELEYDGKVHIYTTKEVTLIIKGKKFIPTEELMPPIIYQDRTLVPVREVFEELGGTVTWNNEERTVEIAIGNNNIKLWINSNIAKVNGKDIELDVPAKLINSKTMVPIRFISENGGFKVDWNQDTYTVTISENSDIEEIIEGENTNDIISIKNIEIKNINGIPYVIILSDKKIEKYNYFLLQDPDRIAVDIYDSEFSNNIVNLKIENDKKIEQIRCGTQEKNVNRVVIDLKEKSEYYVIKSEDNLKIYILISNDIDSINLEDLEYNEEYNNNVNPSQETENSNNESENNNNNVEDKDNVSMTNVTSIKYSSLTDKIKVAIDNEVNYNSFVLSNPDRIVVDIYNSLLDVEGPTSITPNNKKVKSIRFSQYDDTTVRVVFELKTEVNHNITTSNQELQIEIEEKSKGNLEYYNNGDVAQIILSGINFNKLTLSQSNSRNKYLISYSSSDFNPEKKTMQINDNFIEKISITQTKITISDNEIKNLIYTAKQNGNDVIITIKEKEKNTNINERIIAIDVGHGGNDPGAVNGKSYEKTYNLAIALKLYNLLKETDGITVYINRDKDISIADRFDRVEFANTSNADLFVSIHNNAHTNKSYDGTMVLFYNKQNDSLYNVTSKEYAQTVLNELVNTLKTTNRGVVSRSDLVVLTDTNMPAILCEISFISNDDELERLKTDKFQQNAAEAIYRGIMATLEKME